MYNYPRNNGPFGGNNTFGSRYQYQTLAPAYEGTQSSSLISKVMGLLAFSFLFATLGTFVGFVVFANATSSSTFFIVAIAGFVVLLALRFLIQKSGINLFLLYLFTFLEGMSLAPLISYYLANGGYILAEAFLITTLTAFGLAAYSWTTKRDFTRLGDYLFFGLILLLVAGGTWAVFEFVVWNKLPGELVGKWVAAPGMYGCILARSMLGLEVLFA